jgi:hypothetical protein
MTDAPRPVPPLERAARPHPGPGGPWVVGHLAGLVALALGVVGFLVTVLAQDTVWASPDWRIPAPFLGAALIAATVSIVRREGMWAIPLIGVGLAAAALVLGWFVITAIVVAATVVVIIILHSVM